MVMEASQSIQLKTEQKLVISRRLQQQLAILHMTLQEVAALANEQLQSNPMLDVAEGAEAVDSPFSDLSLDALEGRLARSEPFDDGALPVSGGATFYSAGRSEEKTADFLDYTYKPESLEDYLVFQLADYPLSETQKQICRHLIAMLDEHGFFREPLAEAAQLLGIDKFELAQMLYVIQSLDPPGIGARDLQECLILQLAAGDCFNGYTVRIVKEGLELLSQNRIGAIAKLLGVDTAQAKACCDAIRALSPIPTRGFYTGEDSAYVVPDAVVTRQGAELFVQMNDSMIPHLVVNKDYEALLAESKDEGLCSYLRSNLASAKGLISDISARQSTLQRLICAVVDRQRPFFTDGKSLQPMMMSEVAEALGVHVSTVSRAIAGKYIVCAAGTVSLKSLFTSGYASGGLSGAVSAAVIKRRLVELIAAEDHAAPLSDDALCRMFEEMGIHISRRTVAKYREEQGIPSSKCRKGAWA